MTTPFADPFAPFDPTNPEHVALLEAATPVHEALIAERPWLDGNVTWNHFEVLSLADDPWPGIPQDGHILTSDLLSEGTPVLHVSVARWADGKVEVDAVQTPEEKQADDDAFDYGYHVLYYEMKDELC